MNNFQKDFNIGQKVFYHKPESTLIQRASIKEITKYSHGYYYLIVQEDKEPEETQIKTFAVFHTLEDCIDYATTNFIQRINIQPHLE
jgi:hypothetical protein